jgi:signal recognition particle subunit SEC65
MDVFCQIVAEITQRFRSLPIAPSPNPCASSDLTINEYCSFRQDRDDNTGSYFDPRDMSGRELAQFKVEMEQRPLFGQLLDAEGGPGTSPVPEFTAKVWRKVRPDSLKKHGMGKAVKQFNVTCQKTASRLFDADEIASYLDAITTLSDAIEGARRDTKEKKGHDAVKELLDNWRDQLSDYQREVEEARDKSNLRRAADDYHTLTGDNVANGFQKVLGNRGDFTTALEDGNLLLASAKYDLVQKGILDVESALSKNYHQRQANFYGQQYGVAPGQIPKHPDTDTWRTKVAEYAGLLDDMDDEFAAVEDDVFGKHGEPTGGDEQYKKVITEVHQRYREIALEIRDGVPRAKEFVRQATDFLGRCTAPELAAESPQLDELAAAARELNWEMLELEQGLVDLLEESRHSNSPTRKRAKDAGVTQEDEAALLAPFMSVAYKHNKACLTSLNRAKLMVYDGLLSLVERFQVDAASNELRKMDESDYRVQSSLG